METGHPSESSLTRFTNRVEDYAAARPSYPADSIGAILDGLGKPIDELLVVDVGAGTGISTSLFAKAGVRQVIAVEPNEAMRQAIQPATNIRVQNGTAESTGLPDDLQADVIVCAQAYHWFDPPRACAEFARILRKPSTFRDSPTTGSQGGRLALMWNDHDDEAPLSSAYVRLVRNASGMQGDDASTQLPHRQAARSPVVAAPFVAPPRVLTFPNVQRLTFEGLVRRARSASYVPKSGAAWESLERELRALHAQYADIPAEGGEPVAVFRYITRVYLCDLDPEAVGGAAG